METSPWQEYPEQPESQGYEASARQCSATSSCANADWRDVLVALKAVMLSVYFQRLEMTVRHFHQWGRRADNGPWVGGPEGERCLMSRPL